jgi:hypothetical protein
MSEERTVKRVFNYTPKGKMSVGKPRKKWLDDAENYYWRKMAKDRETWKLILREANGGRNQCSRKYAAFRNVLLLLLELELIFCRLISEIFYVYQ